MGVGGGGGTVRGCIKIIKNENIEIANNKANTIFCARELITN